MLSNDTGKALNYRFKKEVQREEETETDSERERGVRVNEICKREGVWAIQESRKYGREKVSEKYRGERDRAFSVDC